MSECHLVGQGLAHPPGMEGIWCCILHKRKKCHLRCDWVKAAGSCTELPAFLPLGVSHCVQLLSLTCRNTMHILDLYKTKAVVYTLIQLQLQAHSSSVLLDNNYMCFEI